MLSSKTQLIICVNQRLSVRTGAAIAQKVQPACEPRRSARSLNFYKHLTREPKRHVNLFSLFTKANWVQGIAFVVQSKRLAKLWKSLSEEEKRPYREASRQYKEKLEARTTSALEDLTDEERFEKVVDEIRGSCTDDLRQRISICEQILGKSKRLPWNSYCMFLRDHFYHNDRKCTDDEYEENLGTKSITRNMVGRAKLIGRVQEVSAKWKRMPPEERKAYRQKYSDLLKQRAREFSNWEQEISRNYLIKKSSFEKILEDRPG